MVSVTEVNVRAPRLSEHHFVSGRAPGVCVASGIGCAGIRLCFDDFYRNDFSVIISYQVFAEEPPCGPDGGARKKFPREPFKF
jgi:hypothetical protein